MKTIDLQVGDRVRTPTGNTLTIVFCDDTGLLVEWLQASCGKVRAYYSHFNCAWNLLPKPQWIALFWRDELKNTVDSSTVYTSEEAVKLHCPTAFKYVQVT